MTLMFGSPTSNAWQSVWALRQRLWKSGYPPVAVYNFNANVSSPGKRPFGDKWQIRARRNPPEAAVAPPAAVALNTGLLCDGLRPVDIDIDDQTVAEAVEQQAIEKLGLAPVRFRADSPRRLALYRAAKGEPRKIEIKGPAGKIEVLGVGQQFVGYGTHPNGATLQWRPDDPALYHRNTLNAVTEAQVFAFLTAAAPLIGAPPSPPMILPPQSGWSEGFVGERLPPTDHERQLAAKTLDIKTKWLSGLKHGDLRNRSMFNICYPLGGMVGAGWISYDEVFAKVLKAAHDCGTVEKHGLHQAEATIRSGLKRGMASPRAPLPVEPMLVHPGQLTNPFLKGKL